MRFVKILRLWVGHQVLGLKIRRRSMMTRDLEKMLVGTIKELLKDRQYFHKSTVGPEYCHLTEEGNRAILTAINLLGPRLMLAIDKEDIERSKQLVLNELKGK